MSRKQRTRKKKERNGWSKEEAGYLESPVLGVEEDVKGKDC